MELPFLGASLLGANASVNHFQIPYCTGGAHIVAVLYLTYILFVYIVLLVLFLLLLLLMSYYLAMMTMWMFLAPVTLAKFSMILIEYHGDNDGDDVGKDVDDDDGDDDDVDDDENDDDDDGGVGPSFYNGRKGGAAALGEW